MDFLDSLFDVDHNGKVDWMDHAMAAAICTMVDEDERRERENAECFDEDDPIDEPYLCGSTICPVCYADLRDQLGFVNGEDWVCEECDTELYYDENMEFYDEAIGRV